MLMIQVCDDWGEWHDADADGWENDFNTREDAEVFAASMIDDPSVPWRVVDVRHDVCDRCGRRAPDDSDHFEWVGPRGYEERVCRRCTDAAEVALGEAVDRAIKARKEGWVL